MAKSTSKPGKQRGRKEKKKVEKEKKTLLGDDPVSNPSEDSFFFYPEAESVANILLKVLKDSSIVFAVRGPWGSGKTSFMKLVQWALEDRKDSSVLPVWFDAWKFTDTVHLGDALIYEALRCMVDELKGKLPQDLKDLKILDKELKHVEEELGKRRDRWFLLKGGFEAAIGTAAKVEAVPAPAKGAIKIGKSIFDSMKSTHKIEASVAKLLKVLRRHYLGLVVFLDDLDRADSDQIFWVLATVKQYLAQKNVAFVMGYDEEYVLKALENNLGEEISASDYLQKIITLTRSIPTPRGEAMENYAFNLLKEVSCLGESAVQAAAFKLSTLTAFNPRRLKRMCLTLGQLSTSYVNKQPETDMGAPRMRLLQSYDAGLVFAFPVILHEYVPHYLDRLAQFLGEHAAFPSTDDLLAGMSQILKPDEIDPYLKDIQERTAQRLKKELTQIPELVDPSFYQVTILLIRSLSGVPDYPELLPPPSQQTKRDSVTVEKTIFQQPYFAKIFEIAVDRGLKLPGKLLAYSGDVQLPEAKLISHPSMILSFLDKHGLGGLPATNVAAILAGKKATWIVVETMNLYGFRDWLTEDILMFCAKKPVILWTISYSQEITDELLEIRDFVERSAMADKVTMFISGPNEIEELQKDLISKLVNSSAD